MHGATLQGALCASHSVKRNLSRMKCVCSQLYEVQDTVTEFHSRRNQYSSKRQFMLLMRHQCRVVCSHVLMTRSVLGTPKAGHSQKALFHAYVVVVSYMYWNSNCAD